MMTLRPDPKYPSRRAYVLKLGQDATPDALGGRLENLVTGMHREFISGEELLESLATDLVASGHATAADPKSG